KNVLHKKEQTKEIVRFFENTSCSPEEMNPVLESHNSAPLKQKVKLSSVITRPGFSVDDLKSGSPALSEFLISDQNFTGDAIEQAEILMKYAGYISKESEMADKLSRLEHVSLSPEFDYRKLTSLSAEAREKLTE